MNSLCVFKKKVMDEFFQLKIDILDESSYISDSIQVFCICGYYRLNLIMTPTLQIFFCAFSQVRLLKFCSWNIML